MMVAVAGDRGACQLQMDLRTAVNLSILIGGGGTKHKDCVACGVHICSGGGGGLVPS